jgi:Nucleotide modification associated domain 2
MRLCRHVITHDSGLAPNPFHGYCTSAVCTPSHMDARLNEGEWLIGHSPIKDGNRLVYAMRISEVLGMNQYFHDDRFESKKPKPDGTLEEQCGDNIYFQDGTGHWKRLPSRFHNHCDNFGRDIGKNLAGHPVFVAEHFYYFGCKRVPIPDDLVDVILRRQGVGYSPEHLADSFVTWLEANYEPGVRGTPRDMADHAGVV